jgi:hypothetical protein
LEPRERRCRDEVAQLLFSITHLFPLSSHSQHHQQPLFHIALGLELGFGTWVGVGWEWDDWESNTKSDSRKNHSRKYHTGKLTPGNLTPEISPRKPLSRKFIRAKTRCYENPLPEILKNTSFINQFPPKFKI